MDFPDAGEIEVAGILLELRILFRKPKPFLGDWGCKRRRSNWNPHAGIEHQSPAPDPPPPPPPRATNPGCTDTPAKKRVKSGGGGGELSPVTPLSFCPSESDDKLSRPHSKKRNREGLNKDVHELIKCRELIVGKLDTMMTYYNNEKTYNLKLKGKKNELQEWGAFMKIADVNENPNEPSTSVIQQEVGLGLVEHHRVGPDRMLGLHVSGRFLGGPAHLLDLAQRMDADKRARYAEARKSRMIKIKLKKIKHSGPLTLPRTRQ